MFYTQIQKPLSSMVTIVFIKARKIFESYGNQTLEADINLSNESFHRAAVSSDAPTDVHKALELRDGGKDYLGKGVSKAVSNVQDIIRPALVGRGLTDQCGIDKCMVETLDGTQNEWGRCK
ncbi:hypothetical protein KP509_06G006300 [Ceratopteris richardii]|uniref:Enolase N-terminal domain-containing protein n=1 Tax=Ceratopteris richardii TaxID=49495 RepID=A0A8T2UD82_CERRI|nr:hypothetical protein KP509_06G006300 [Ceratopteris richardii]